MQVTDCGVVGYFTGVGGQTNVKDNSGNGGQPLTATAIGSGAPGLWMPSVNRVLAAGQFAQWTVNGILSLSGSQSVKVRAEIQRNDPNNPGLFAWAGIMLTRGDNGAVATEHNILAADLQSVLSGAAWAPTTSYAKGAVVNNDSGKPYICTAAGTSAGSGGPTGQGTAIVDGTCTWAFLQRDVVLQTTDTSLAGNVRLIHQFQQNSIAADLLVTALSILNP